MWYALWLLPPVLFVWAIVLVVRKVRSEGEVGEARETKPATLAERLAELEAEEKGEIPGSDALIGDEAQGSDERSNQQV